MRTVSELGYGMPGLIILGLTLALLVFKRMGKEGMLLLALLIVSSGLNSLIKELVARPRPSDELVQVFQDYNGFSFPSGHVMTYMAFLGMLGVIVTLRMRPCLAKWFIQGGLLVGLFAVGVSRIYLGAHWLGDVVAAYALGAALIAAIFGLWRLWINMEARPSR
ncbi:MAG: phosphatase PAP2 family protein [Chloroflexi bacterium]|nr:phosphatase PAP2 family protein [Chloroflexota bacterium]